MGTGKILSVWNSIQVAIVTIKDNIFRDGKTSSSWLLKSLADHALKQSRTSMVEVNFILTEKSRTNIEAHMVDALSTAAVHREGWSHVQNADLFRKPLPQFATCHLAVSREPEKEH